MFKTQIYIHDKSKEIILTKQSNIIHKYITHKK